MSGGAMAVLFWMSAAYSVCMVWSRSIGDCPAPHTKQREKKGTAYADQIQTRRMVDRMAGETYDGGMISWRAPARIKNTSKLTQAGPACVVSRKAKNSSLHQRLAPASFHVRRVKI